MTARHEEPQPFTPDPAKTYSLMELARGTSPLVDKEPEDTVMTWPHLVLVELLGALGMTLLLLVLSLLRDAPLEEFANPEAPPNPAKAAWYLMGVQELILHLHPAWGAIILPGIITLLLMAIPYLDRDTSDVGVWFSGPRGRRIAAWTARFIARACEMRRSSCETMFSATSLASSSGCSISLTSTEMCLPPVRRSKSWRISLTAVPLRPITMPGLAVQIVTATWLGKRSISTRETPECPTLDMMYERMRSSSASRAVYSFGLAYQRERQSRTMPSRMP